MILNRKPVQKVTSSTTDLGKLETNSVDLSLVLETVFTGKLEFGIETSTVVSPFGHRVSLRVASRGG